MAQFASLPVITRGLPARLGYAVFLSVLDIICLRTFWFDWLWWRPVINGGALAGVLSHPIPMLLGSVLHDWCLWYPGSATCPRQHKASGMTGQLPEPDSAAICEAGRMHRWRYVSINSCACRRSTIIFDAVAADDWHARVASPTKQQPRLYSDDSRQPVPCAGLPRTVSPLHATVP